MVQFPTNILGSLETARTALLAQQAALTTVGHNLANAATPGYTRQRTEFVPANPQRGVDVATVRRIRDRFLDFSLLNEQQNLGKSQAEHAMLDRLQAVFDDPPGSGLSAVLDQFFQGFQDLAVNPTAQAARVSVAQGAQRLAATFQQMRGRIGQLKGDLQTEIQNDVTDANSLLAQIGDLHRQIIAAQGGPPPNDLLDRRDQLVSELAGIIGVRPIDRSDGTVQLAVAGSGVLLVDGLHVAPLTATLNPGTDTVDLTVGGDAIAVTPQSGALGAVLTGRNSPTGAVKQAQSDLDSLASAIIAEVNRIHASGTGLSEPATVTAVNAVSSSAAALTAAGLPFTPVTGSFKVIVHDATGAVTSQATIPITAGVTTLDDVRAALGAVPGLTATISSGTLTVSATVGSTVAFAADTSDTLLALGLNTFFTGSDAQSIGVNATIVADPNAIATARADADGLVHPGDGANALALARLRTALSMAGGTASFVDFYGTAVGRVGAQARDALQAVDRQQSAVQVVQSLQQQTSGVSTDEELITLTQSQAAYAAAGRFVSTIQALFDTLLDMTK